MPYGRTRSDGRVLAAPCRRHRRVLGVALVAVLAAACGSGADGDGIEAGSPSSAQLGEDSGYTKVIPGDSALLRVDLATRDVHIISPGDGEAIEANHVGSVPGSGPLVNVTAVQRVDGSWLVGGNNCDTAEATVPAGCDDGTYIVAELRSGEWSSIGGVPSEFDRVDVNLRNESDGHLLLEQRDSTDSAFWVFDSASGEFREVGWRPASLPATDELLVDDEIAALQPVRTSCLVGGELLVIDGIPAADGLQSIATWVSVDSAEQLSESRLAIEYPLIQDHLLCSEALPSPVLIGMDKSTDSPVAFPVEQRQLGQAISLEERPAGELVDLTYGQAGVTFQYTSDAGVNISEETNGTGSITASGQTTVVSLVNGRWQVLSEPVSINDAAVPLSPDMNSIIVEARTSGTFTLVSGG